MLKRSTLELEHRVNIPTSLAIYLSTFCLRNSAGSNITSCYLCIAAEGVPLPSHCWKLWSVGGSFFAALFLVAFSQPIGHSFQLHLLRWVYQLTLWRQSLHAMIEIPGHVEYGHERERESQKYYPNLMSQTTATPELLNNLVYSCALNKCDEQCICAINEQLCTVPTGKDDDENIDGHVHCTCTCLLH